MKKQTYMKPTIQVVKIQQTQMLCASITEVISGDDVDIDIGEGGTVEPARSPLFDDSDDNFYE